ncbi:hypothetical protein LX76_00354 [Cereibacter changlensis]|uniref:Uncharacterized protein n=1 Tax=Cereibacter changlensis TaxID=402884 RepID=A0A2W7RW67_9RHOB|nr:hypothetical protein LX76_00354 [Cereibacter changlensis]
MPASLPVRWVLRRPRASGAVGLQGGRDSGRLQPAKRPPPVIDGLHPALRRPPMRYPAALYSAPKGASAGQPPRGWRAMSRPFRKAILSTGLPAAAKHRRARSDFSRAKWSPDDSHHPHPTSARQHAQLPALPTPSCVGRWRRQAQPHAPHLLVPAGAFPQPEPVLAALAGRPGRGAFDRAPPCRPRRCGAPPVEASSIFLAFLQSRRARAKKVKALGCQALAIRFRETHRQSEARRRPAQLTRQPPERSWPPPAGQSALPAAARDSPRQGIHPAPRHLPETALLPPVRYRPAVQRRRGKPRAAGPRVLPEQWR